MCMQLGLCQKVIRDCGESLNVLAEKKEKRWKDERKKLRERRQVDVEVALHYTHPACVFVAVNKAGLTNHTCQKHMLPLKSMCQFCKQLSHQQGLHNHPRHFSKRRIRHNFLACITPITSGKWNAYSI